MKKILAAIQDGSFAEEWRRENEDGQKNMAELRKENTEHPIETVGSKLRGMMSWLPSNKKKEKVA